MLAPLLTVIHVIGIVLWIGGVAFVTIIVFPMIMRMEGSMEKVMFFQGVEHRFAKIVKPVVAIVGITGIWLLYLTGEWRVLFKASGIGPTLMVIVWTLYVLVLLFEGRLFKIIFKAEQDTSKIFFRLTVFHWVILSLSFLAIVVGVWAAHGKI